MHGRLRTGPITGPHFEAIPYGWNSDGFLGTSLLHLKEMGKLLPGEWYDAEVEDDGIARLLPILVYILLVFLLSHFIFHVQSHYCRQLLDDHQAKMRAQAVRRKREHAHTLHSSKKRKRVILFICADTVHLYYLFIRQIYYICYYDRVYCTSLDGKTIVFVDPIHLFYLVRVWMTPTPPRIMKSTPLCILCSKKLYKPFQNTLQSLTV